MQGSLVFEPAVCEISVVKQGRGNPPGADGLIERVSPAELAFRHRRTCRLIQKRERSNPLNRYLLFATFLLVLTSSTPNARISVNYDEFEKTTSIMDVREDPEVLCGVITIGPTDTSFGLVYSRICEQDRFPLISRGDSLKLICKPDTTVRAMPVITTTNLQRNDGRWTWDCYIEASRDAFQSMSSSDTIKCKIGCCEYYNLSQNDKMGFRDIWEAFGKSVER